MNRAARACTSAALAWLVSSGWPLAAAVTAGGAPDRARVWRGNASRGETAPAEWTDGDATTFAAWTPEAPDSVVHIGFEWSEPRPVAALEVDFLAM